MSACFHVSGVCVLVQQQLWAVLNLTLPGRTAGRLSVILIWLLQSSKLSGRENLYHCCWSSVEIVFSNSIHFVLKISWWALMHNQNPHTVTEGEPLVKHIKCAFQVGQCLWPHEQFRAQQGLAQKASSRQEEEMPVREVGSGHKGQHSLLCYSHPLTAAELWLQDVLMGELGGLPRSLYPDERLSQERLFDCQIVSCWLWHMTSTPHF